MSAPSAASLTEANLQNMSNQPLGLYNENFQRTNPARFSCATDLRKSLSILFLVNSSLINNSPEMKFERRRILTHVHI